MPDSIKAIGPVSEAATAREHATAHIVWHIGGGKLKHHAQPERRRQQRTGAEDRAEPEEPSNPSIHHIDIIA